MGDRRQAPGHLRESRSLGAGSIPGRAQNHRMLKPAKTVGYARHNLSQINAPPKIARRFAAGPPICPGRARTKINLVCEVRHTGVKPAPVISAKQEKVSKGPQASKTRLWRQSCTQSLQPIVPGPVALRRAWSVFHSEGRIQ